MPTATLTHATVETIGRPKPSKYEGKPDYRPVLFNLPDGTQRWKSYSVDAPELTWLKKGESYQAAISGDDMTLIQPNDAAPDASHPQAQPHTQQGSQGMSAEQKREIAAYVVEMGDLYAYCLQTAQTKIGASSDSETVRAMASSLFISAQRKFGLA